MSDPVTHPFRNVAALKRLRRRRAADSRFRFYGIAAVGIAMLALLTLLTTIITKATQAATTNTIAFELALDPAMIAPPGKDSPQAISRNVEGFYRLMHQDLQRTFPETAADPELKREVGLLVTRLAAGPLARETALHPERIGQTVRVSVPISDDVDLFLKGTLTDTARAQLPALDLGPVDASGVYPVGSIDTLRPVFAAVKALEDSAGVAKGRSVLVVKDASVGRLVFTAPKMAHLKLLTGSAEAFKAGPVDVRVLAQPETERTVSDQQIAWTLALKAQDRIQSGLHSKLLTESDSTYPELAGALAAIVGSLFTVIITAAIAIPVGVFASVYLEEFAPKNRITNLIEVNINNLAAVPSIVFGLLGAAIFLGFFGMPRSAPLVGGMVLALMTLPVVIIASRAALKAVPPSIRAGALAVGASKMQSVFHHVLPLAAPGIFTGSILGLARALGETAPLLLIGMVAFINQPPTSPLDESTALPVLIFSWANRAERAWEPMTAAIIVILLVFLILMNLAVVILRRRFERRW